MRSVSPCFCLALLALARPAAPSGPAVRGIVVDQSGAAIPGAQLTLESPPAPARTTASGPLGRFEFSGLPAGGYTLTVAQEGFMPERRRFELVASPLELRIQLAAAPIRQTLVVSETPGYQISTASSATRTALPLRDIPQAVQVVNRELIRSQAALSMQDVLRNVSGVSLHLGEGRRDQVFIRGNNAMRDSYVDGVRDDATYYRDLSTTEQVEVIKGPASVLYGRGSSGGIVNRVTKKPDLERPLGEVSLMGGSYGTKRTAVDLGLPLSDGRLAFRLNGAYEDSGSHRHFYSLDRYTVAPAVTWRPAEQTQVLAQFEHLADDRVPDRGIPSLNGRPALAAGAGSYYGDPGRDFLNNQVTAQALTFDHQFNPAWSVRNVFRHSKYRNAYSNTYPTGIRASEDGILVTRGQYNSNGYQENYFNQSETMVGFALPGTFHTVLAGVEAGSQTTRTDRFTGSALPVSLRNPVLTHALYSARPALSNGFDGGVLGLYVQDQIRINGRWKALLGLRRDRFRQYLDDLLPANADLGRTDYAWSPRAGAVFQATGWLSLYASYSRSFQPSGEGLSLAANNSDLKPEITENYEAGAKSDLLGGALSASLAVFRLNRNNIRTIDPVDPSRLVLVGRQRTQGIELSLSGTVWRRLNLYGGYAWLDARVLRSNDGIEGNRPGHVPLHSASLWTTVDLPKGLGLGGGLAGNTSRFTANDNQVLLPGYARVDMAFFYRTRRYDLALNLRNLLNTRYYETAHGNFTIYPGAPANGLLTLRLRW
ncbi:MAG: TonB-dependent siderophore receptor [Bryobacterales bacterium]|nr:TonB-dependent siderophore receptor [Bryobacterales bacterium]